MNLNVLKEILKTYSQEHLLQFWDELADVEAEEFFTEIESNERSIKEVLDYYKKYGVAADSIRKTQDENLEPIPSDYYGGTSRTPNDVIEGYEAEGYRLISEGRVGVILLAGGIGTRLGSSNPKGMYDVGLPSHKSLFQIQAERIRKLMDLSFQATKKRGNIIWYILTSDQTKEPTRRFLIRSNYFGLQEENVVLFEQSLLPTLTFDGKLMLQAKNKVSMSPGGNGGLYKALLDEKILDDMDKRGVEFLHVHSVDNILVKVADPVFVGYCSLKNAESGVKVISKISPTEPLGVICLVDNKYRVVEYSEISTKMAEKRKDDGSLVFNAGNICNHVFTVEFLRKVATEFENKLPLHVAKKKISYIDQNGNLIKPEKPNGIKLEKFIFDVFQFTEKLVVWEVNREEEFSALKNSDREVVDNATTARSAVFKLHKRMIEDAGGKVECEPDSENICEISPLVTYAGEGLGNVVAGKVWKCPVLIKSELEI